MDMVLGYDLEPAVFVYVDDIVVATDTFQEHIDMLKKVSERLKTAGLTINVQKSKFCVPTLKYLGYIIDRDGLRPDPEKIKAILDFPIPKTGKSVRRIVGMCGWYRRFIQDFATIISPITELLKKGSKRFRWTDEAGKAFETLKQKLTSAPVLRNPDFFKKFTIQCDASDVGVGAVITQEEDGVEKVIAFMSQKLTSAQKKYSTTEKECLAVILAVEKFSGYVQGVKFDVVTDHSALTWLQSMKEPSGRLWRWIMRLQRYNIHILHRKGKDNIVPDALSRSVEVASLVKRSLNKDWYEELFEKVKKDDNILDYRIKGDDLLKRCVGIGKFGNRSVRWKIVVPPDKITSILLENHDSPLAAHFGYHKTLKRITSKWYWPNMCNDIRAYIRFCDVCK